MVSEKNERLINLAIALIAAKRPLSKEQLQKSIQGYSGNQDAKDRMFERDKDLLKSLGINITIAPIDPLFDDEVGYRITQSDYSITLDNLSPKEIGLLTVAAKIWDQTSLEDEAKAIVRRLHSMGVAAEIPESPARPNPNALTEIMSAIHSDNCISFSYIDEEGREESRSFAPYAVSGNQGLWYVHGKDLQNNQIRTFRLDRFSSSIIKLDEKIERPKEFKVPKFSDQEVISKIRIRKDSGQSLRLIASEIVDDGEWDIATIKFLSIDILVKEVLWYESDVVVLEPVAARNRVISALDELVAQHGR